MMKANLYKPNSKYGRFNSRQHGKDGSKHPDTKIMVWIATEKPLGAPCRLMITIRNEHGRIRTLKKTFGYPVRSSDYWQSVFGIGTYVTPRRILLDRSG